MARYEGMDEILQRLSLRFGQEGPSPGPLSEPAQSRSPASRVAIEGVHYRATVASIDRLRQETQHLREVLTEPGAREFSQQEHEQLMALLGQVFRDLWSCEDALQRTAPFD